MTASTVRTRSVSVVGSDGVKLMVNLVGLPPVTSIPTNPISKLFASTLKLVAPKARSVTEHLPAALVVHDGAVPLTWAVI